MQHHVRRERLLVAVVDDDKPIVDLLCELLQEEGYQTVACLTAIEAHRVIRKTRPNLVILDLHLDGSGNGLTVLDTLRLVPATDVSTIIHRSQQLDKRSQLLIKEAQRLRLQSLNLARENMSIQSRLDYVSWLTAMAGPQPRWLWRKRTSYDE